MGSSPSPGTSLIETVHESTGALITPHVTPNVRDVTRGISTIGTRRDSEIKYTIKTPNKDGCSYGHMQTKKQ